MYRRSIWDDNPKYKTGRKNLSPDLVSLIDTIQSVESAKKNTPPIPLKNLIEMAEQKNNLPEPSKITIDQFEKVLDTFCCYGAGVKTTIAIVARLSDGKYPPIDKKNISGLCKKGVITTSDGTSLNGNSHGLIAKIYVEKVLPEWRRELEKGKLPKEIDGEWARAE